MLEIRANKTLAINGEGIDIGNNSMSDFLISVLGIPIKLDENLTIGNLVHTLYELTDFIRLYCSEEYEVGRTLINAGRMAIGSDYVRIYKTLEIDSNNALKINVKSEIEMYEGGGKIQNVSNLKIILDEKILDEDGVVKDGVDLKADFTLLEIVEVLFEDFLYTLRKENVLI